MSRRPGDISPILTQITNVKSTYNSSFTPITTSSSSTVFKDKRPSYGKGLRSMIGSTLWTYPTPYTHHSRQVKHSGSAAYLLKFPNGRFTGTIESAPDVESLITVFGKTFYDAIDASVVYNTQSAAQVKALNNISDQKAGLGEDLATYLQTVRMFKNKADALHAILNAAKKGKLGKHLNSTAKDLAKKGDKVAAQAYLEYVYGWKPLVSDLYGIIQLLKQYSSGVKPVIIHGHGSQQLNTSSVYNSPDRATSKQPDYGWLTNEQCRSSCDIYARVNPDYIVFRILNQLGLLNPASFAWELTPWSFIVDWFIPIGPVLSALTAPVGLNFISGTTATRCSRSIEGRYRQYSSALGGVVVIDTPCTFTAVDELYSRSVLTGWPFPTPYLNLNPLAGDRSFKALALAISRLR